MSNQKKQIYIRVHKIYVDLLDELVKEGFYANRALAITEAVRDLLVLHGKWPPPPKKP